MGPNLDRGVIGERFVDLRDGRRCVIRPAQPDDAASILSHVRAVAAEKVYLRSERVDRSVEDERAWIERFDGRNGVLLVATIDGKLVGTSDFSRGRNKKDAHVAELGLAVRRKFRGRGVGRALLTQGIEWARGAHIRKVTLEVFESNVDAIALYRNLGFVEEARQTHQAVLRNVPTDAVHMSLWLDPFPARMRARVRPTSTPLTKTDRPLIVIIRGPMGAGKTTLMRGLVRRSPYRLWALDSDAATEGHPSDPYGEHLATEWPIEIEILALHARIVLGRGLNLVLDSGELLHESNVDRFLELIGRSKRDPRVVVFRLTVSPGEAVRRKTTVGSSYVRASHKGWQPTAVPGEIMIDTDPLDARGVLRIALQALHTRFGRDRIGPTVQLRHVPRRRFTR